MKKALVFFCMACLVGQSFVVQSKVVKLHEVLFRDNWSGQLNKALVAIKAKDIDELDLSNTKVTVKQFKTICEKFDTIVKLNLRGCPLVYHGMEEIAEIVKAKKVSKLDLSDFADVYKRLKAEVRKDLGWLQDYANTRYIDLNWSNFGDVYERLQESIKHDQKGLEGYVKNIDEAQQKLQKWKKGLKEVINLIFIKVLEPARDQITELVLDNAGLAPGVMAVMLKKRGKYQAPNTTLKVLDVSNNPNFYFNQIPYFTGLRKLITKNNTFVASVYISGSVRTGLDTTVVGLKDVEYIDFSGCKGMKYFDFSTRQNITHVILDGSDVSDAMLQPVLSYGKLEALSLYDTSITQKFLRSLGRSKSVVATLKELSYRNKTDIVTRSDVPKLFKAFGMFSNLQNIKIPYLYDGSDLVHLKTLPLKEVYFDKVFRDYNFNGFSDLSEGITSLTFVLDIREKGAWGWVKDWARYFFRSETQSFSHFKNLKRLTVIGMKHFNDSHLLTLPKGMEDVRAVKCGNISLMSFVKMKQLKNLALNRYVLDVGRELKNIPLETLSLKDARFGSTDGKETQFPLEEKQAREWAAYFPDTLRHIYSTDFKNVDMMGALAQKFKDKKRITTIRRYGDIYYSGWGIWTSIVA